MRPELPLPPLLLSTLLLLSLGLRSVLAAEGSKALVQTAASKRALSPDAPLEAEQVVLGQTVRTDGRRC